MTKEGIVTTEIFNDYLKKHGSVPRTTEELVSVPNKKRQFIYLAGNISDDIRTYEWREKFTNYFKLFSKLHANYKTQRGSTCYRY